MGKMTCPVCGEEYDDMDYVIGENGNPICRSCYETETSTEEQDVSDE